MPLFIVHHLWSVTRVCLFIWSKYINSYCTLHNGQLFRPHYATQLQLHHYTSPAVVSAPCCGDGASADGHQRDDSIYPTQHQKTRQMMTGQ